MWAVRGALLSDPLVRRVQLVRLVAAVPSLVRREHGQPLSLRAMMRTKYRSMYCTKEGSKGT